MRPLSPMEARVLSVLVEKQKTVPDTYPLSLNTLAAGCNQKTARDPVMQASEAEILVAIDGLKQQSLVFEGSGSRVVRFEHNMGRVMNVPGQSVALLAVLMLRGPQTSAELRLNGERLHKFADISSVEGFLEELAEKDPPKVLKLPRSPGEREHRWVHLLCGEVALPAPRVFAGNAAESASGSGPDISAGEWAALRAEQTRQAQEIAALKATLERLCKELGLEG